MSARGTVDFTFKGEALTLRPDLQAIVEIEESLGKTLVSIGIQTSLGGGIRLKDLYTIVWGGLRGHYRGDRGVHKAPSIDEVAEEIYENGMMNPKLTEAVSDFIVNAISTPDEIEAASNGGVKKKKKKK